MVGSGDVRLGIGWMGWDRWQVACQAHKIDARVRRSSALTRLPTQNCTPRKTSTPFSLASRLYPLSPVWLFSASPT